MTPEPNRPRCTACESLYGTHDALPADVLCSSVLMPGKMIALCAGHAVERGYIGAHGFPVGNHVTVINLLDSNGEPLPVCAACGEVIPELEIYYTIQDVDYCQHCGQGALDKLSPADLDAWLIDPK